MSCWREGRLWLLSPALSFFLTAADYQRPWSWTHREWLGRITQTANMFRKLGVGRQDVIAFVMPNLPETHWVIWGGEAAGIVFAINPLLESLLILDLLLAARQNGSSQLVRRLDPISGKRSLRLLLEYLPCKEF